MTRVSSIVPLKSVAIGYSRSQPSASEEVARPQDGIRLTGRSPLGGCVHTPGIWDRGMSGGLT